MAEEKTSTAEGTVRKLYLGLRDIYSMGEDVCALPEAAPAQGLS